jgi:hypothetical protein
MNRAVCTILMAATLVLPLGGCGSMPDAPDFDPTEWLAGDWFGTKKPLPGERKELFPGGVPGVSRGVPPDLVKGNQAPSGAEDTAPVAEEPKPKPKPKAKPRPKVAAKPAPVAPASTPTSVTVRRADQPPPQQQQQQQQQQQSSGVQWPDPPPPVQQRQGPGAVQWPDPPPPR